ncbi:MAG: photosynthesis system II assembly factor Ycf48 [Mastigocoleus sp.]
MSSIVKSWQKILTLSLVILLCFGCSKVESTAYNPWEVINLPTENKVLDLAFVDNSKHGYLVGGSSTILETQDGGNTWNSLEVNLDSDRYRLSSISFSGKEGWIVGEPALMLHTEDEGASWSQIPLDEKLPGNPIKIVALGKSSAEMATDVGAIYTTDNGGQNWQAEVEEAVGVVRNLKRSPDGKYVAVSAKGNFYSTWEPGQRAWSPFNRNSSRRVENMGFTGDGRMWMLARGGQIQFSDPENPQEWLDPEYPELSTSWGLLDAAYRTPEEMWIGGGSGNLLLSTDGGETWDKDRDVENVATNFYKITFFGKDKGFVIGDRGGILLKYNPDIAKAAVDSVDDIDTDSKVDSSAA